MGEGERRQQNLQLFTIANLLFIKFQTKNKVPVVNLTFQFRWLKVDRIEVKGILIGYCIPDRQHFFVHIQWNSSNTFLELAMENLVVGYVRNVGNFF